jgi:hypothetical protein
MRYLCFVTMDESRADREGAIEIRRIAEPDEAPEGA